MSAHRPSPSPRPRGLARHTWRFASFAGLAALATLSLAACTSDPQPTVVTETASPPTQASAAASADATATASAEPSQPAPAAETPLAEDAPAAAAPFPADTLPDTETASADAFLSPVTMRFGAHQGYDRIVIDLEGTGTPGWDARYVDTPVAEGSGEPVTLAGDADLQVDVTGVVYPTEPGAHAYVGPANFTPTSGGVVEEVRFGGIFEGRATVFVGLESEQPFRVFLLTGPLRIVVDVQTP